MSEFDDNEPRHEPPISAEDAEALLAATAGTGSFDPDLAELRRLLEAARQPGAPEELATLAMVIASFRGAFEAANTDPAAVITPPSTRRRGSKPKVVIGISAITLLSAGAAAAATGNLPNPFEARPASVPSHATSSPSGPFDEIVAVDAPVPTEDPVTANRGTIAAGAPIDSGQSTSTVVSAATTPAVVSASSEASLAQLCAEYIAVEHDSWAGGDPTSSPFRVLLAAAARANQAVDDFCAAATSPAASASTTIPTTTTAASVPATGTVPVEAESAPGQSGESPSATAPGQSGESPSVTAPGQSGESPSDTAPGQTGESPSATAPGQSGESPSATAPGQSSEAPSATAPGQSSQSPSATAPEQSGESPSATAPGKAGGVDK